MRQIAKPDHKKLRPEKIQPQKREARNQHTETLDLIRPEVFATICDAHCHDNRDHGGGSREHIAKPEVNWKNGAMPVRDQHHPEIPGDERIAEDKSDQYYRREEVELFLNVIVIDIVVTAGHVGPQALSCVYGGQSIKQQQSAQIAD